MDGIDAIMILLEKKWEEMAAETSKHLYNLREETLEKLNSIRLAFSDQSTEIDATFDAVSNTVCMEVRDYVFDTFNSDMATAFALADTVVIDAMRNGLVCISLLIQNAADLFA